MNVGRRSWMSLGSLGSLGLAACSGASSPPGPVAPGAPMAAGAAATTVRPVAMAGPFKSQLDACVAAPPCGGTREAPGKVGVFTDPPAVASCLDTDANAMTNDGKPAELAHGSGDLALRFASQHCAVPAGIRYEHDVYYAFVQRADGWWRSPPLWDVDYNEKYSSATTAVTWTDEPGYALAAVTAGFHTLACGKLGTAASELSLLVRFDRGGAAPAVFAPIVVGEVYTHEVSPAEAAAAASHPDCQPASQRYSLAMSWSGSDDLALAGPSTWLGVAVIDGALATALDPSRTGPSAAGHYRFAR